MLNEMNDFLEYVSSHPMYLIMEEMQNNLDDLDFIKVVDYCYKSIMNSDKVDLIGKLQNMRRSVDCGAPVYTEFLKEKGRCLYVESNQGYAWIIKLDGSKSRSYIESKLYDILPGYVSYFNGTNIVNSIDKDHDDCKLFLDDMFNNLVVKEVSIEDVDSFREMIQNEKVHECIWYCDELNKDYLNSLTSKLISVLNVEESGKRLDELISKIHIASSNNTCVDYDEFIECKEDCFYIEYENGESYFSTYKGSIYIKEDVDLFGISCKRDRGIYNIPKEHISDMLDRVHSIFYYVERGEESTMLIEYPCRSAEKHFLTKPCLSDSMLSPIERLRRKEREDK